MKLRMTMIVGALAAMAMVGCSNNRGTGGSGAVQNDRQDLAQTEQNAHQNVNDARRDAQKNINDAKQNLAQTEQNAQQNVAQAKQNAQQKIDDQRQQLAQDENNANQTAANDNASAANDNNGPQKLASQSGTVLGTLTDMDKDSLTVKDNAGNSVQLKRDRSTDLSTHALRKGAEVRAAFRVDDSGDKWATTVTQIASPANNPLRNQ